jgi:hypothetical protein
MQTDEFIEEPIEVDFDDLLKEASQERYESFVKKVDQRIVQLPLNEKLNFIYDCQRAEENKIFEAESRKILGDMRLKNDLIIQGKL